MSGRLAGKRILLTGGVANIGRAVLQEFVAEGARVFVGDLNTELGAKLQEEVGTSVRFGALDVTSEASIVDFVAAGVKWLNGLDVLVQNAGLQHSGSVTEFDSHRWDALFAVNSRAHFFGAKHAIPHLRSAGKGSIVNTASLAGQRGGPGLTAYSASKGAVIAFGTALAMELAPDNIRVNTVCPGWVETPFNQPAISFMGGRQKQEDVVRKIVPLGRQATPSEIAPLFVYLASDESSYMTAQAITVDGGVYN